MRCLKKLKVLNKEEMKLDIMAIAAHPDDAELSAVGTLIKAKKQGKKIGIVRFNTGRIRN